MWEQSFPVVSDRHPFVRSEVKVVKCVRRHKEVVMMFANWTGVFTTIAISKFVQRHEKRVGEGRGRDSFDDYLEKCLFGALLNLKKKNKKMLFQLMVRRDLVFNRRPYSKPRVRDIFASPPVISTV